MSVTRTDEMQHARSVGRLWESAKRLFHEHFGKSPPEILRKQFETDRRTWEAEDIEVSAFLGELAALAAKNGWQFQIEAGCYACLVPYLFGAISGLPEDIDGKTRWPWDCVCTVSAELFVELPELFRETFDAFYYPVQVCDNDENEDPVTEQIWTLLPKTEPLPYGTEAYGEWTPEDDFGGRLLQFKIDGLRK